jgi:hypothetical protein
MVHFRANCIDFAYKSAFKTSFLSKQIQNTIQLSPQSHPGYYKQDCGPSCLSIFIFAPTYCRVATTKHCSRVVSTPMYLGGPGFKLSLMAFSYSFSQFLQVNAVIVP